MRTMALLLAAFLADASPVGPSRPAAVCLAGGASGIPLDRCLVDGRFGPVPQPELRSTADLRAWANRWFPVGSERVGWTVRGEQRKTRVTRHDFEGDLGVPVVTFDEHLALVASGPLELHVLPAADGALDVRERSSLESAARRLRTRALPLRLPDEATAGEFVLGVPTVSVVPGASGVRTVVLPVTLPDGDARGSFFFLVDGAGRITFERFGHPEWSPGAGPEDVARFEPLFFFRVGALPTTYLLTTYQEAWESWGRVAILDPARAAVVTR